MSVESFENGYARFRNRLDRDREHNVAPEGEQQPYLLWIGCSDSRVIPELILDARPGEVFVHRNIANIVPPYGVACDAVAAPIEFAVLQLHVQMIVVCGHTECGGIRALSGALELGHLPHLARWIEWARPAMNISGSSNIAEAEKNLEAVRANVLLQRENARSYPFVNEAVQAGRLVLSACVYDMRAGVLEEYADPAGGWRPVPARALGGSVIDLPENRQAAV